MFDASGYREIISGRRTGWMAASCRGALCLAEWGYSAAVLARNHLFDRGILRQHRAQIPVISVGNLTVGGTGKTPFVLWLARWCLQRGVRPALLSRGYGASPGQRNDEGLELDLRVPGVCHIQNPDRVRSAEQAVAQHMAQVLILDDGFQHRRLARDLDIVLIDASQPFGFDHLLPRGLLRESISSLRRADAVVLTRSNLASADEKLRIQARVRRYVSAAAWAEVEFVPTQLIDLQQNIFPLSELRGARIYGFAGIGEPDNFRQALSAMADQLVGFRAFPDHHAYTHKDFRALVQSSRETNADYLVCTWKDLVKIPPGSFDPLPLRAVAIETRFTEGLVDVERLLGAVIPSQ